MIFFYHTGLQALEVRGPDGKLIFRIATTVLRQLGWQADDIQLARALPRADKSILSVR
ncbi:MAG TPA: hypothetical protein VEZ44_09250 [bacterium]|nr:hypothetical protein [bacterium]